MMSRRFVRKFQSEVSTCISFSHAYLFTKPCTVVKLAFLELWKCTTLYYTKKNIFFLFSAFLKEARLVKFIIYSLHDDRTDAS